MQSMRNATPQLNKTVWPRRRADKLSAAALRPSKIGVGGAHEFSRCQRCALGLHSSLVTPSQAHSHILNLVE